jgi:putative DNA-invertase from lambdoid prophage Rac
MILWLYCASADAKDAPALEFFATSPNGRVTFQLLSGTEGARVTVWDCTIGRPGPVLMFSPTSRPTLSYAIDLTGGIGGFKTAAAALSALKSDGQRGTLLSFGSGSSLDFRRGSIVTGARIELSNRTGSRYRRQNIDTAGLDQCRVTVMNRKQRKMSRTFAYTRVSSIGQSVRKQIQEIEAAGFHVEPPGIISEIVSGNCAIGQRPGFLRLLDKMERDDVLVVTKLDRLGRNAIEVATTVKELEALGVRVHCLALGRQELTSSAERQTMNVLVAVAEFERDLLVERTRTGLEQAKADGKTLGRPLRLNDKQRAAVRAQLAAGASVSAVARQFGMSRASIIRTRNNELLLATERSRDGAAA